MKKKMLLSAFACDPFKGSESGNGWNWATGLVAENYEVHCLTRGSNRAVIELAGKKDCVEFYYISLPFGLEKLYGRSQAAMYIYYMLWQYKAYLTGKSISKRVKLDVAHHVTWGSLQMGSFLYKLKLPFVFGPCGGGQKAPEAFKKYFLSQWSSEIKREKISRLMMKFNPAFKSMVKKASAILISNVDTLKLAKKHGSEKVFLSFDTALPHSFFPSVFVPKNPEPHKLKLLWVGRFMPRKGVSLILDVMNELKAYPGISLTVVGDGEIKNTIVEKIETLNLNDSVRLTGRVPYEQVREFYQSHDVFFFTSLRDSGPSQLIEASAFGMPIITINLHGQALIVTDKTGIVCDCEAPEIAIGQLKSAILSLYNNPDKVNLMSKAAFEFAKEQIWPIKIRKIVKEYYPS